MMPHEVIGPFTNMEKAVSKVEVLGLKGYRADDINIIAKEDIAKEHEDKVDATVISAHHRTDDQPHQHLHETLQDLDMSEDQTERYQQSIHDNSIIIALDTDEYRMGNEYIRDPKVLTEDLY